MTPSAQGGEQAYPAMWRGQRIVTHYVYPPIPVRDFDWSAVLEGYDGADGGDPQGTGPTEQAAIADLVEQLEDMEAT